MNLQSMLNTQKYLQEKVNKKTFMNVNETENVEQLKEIISLIKGHSYFLIEETTECLRELPFHKFWKEYDLKNIDEMLDKAKKEYIDMFIFLLNIGAYLGLTEKDIIKLYEEKNKINLERQENPELGYVASKIKNEYDKKDLSLCVSPTKIVKYNKKEILGKQLKSIEDVEQAYLNGEKRVIVLFDKSKWFLPFKDCFGEIITTHKGFDIICKDDNANLGLNNFSYFEEKTKIFLVKKH